MTEEIKELKKLFKEKVSPHTTSAFERLFIQGIEDFSIIENKVFDNVNNANQKMQESSFRAENEYLKIHFVTEKTNNLNNNNFYNNFIQLKIDDKKRNLNIFKMHFDKSVEKTLSCQESNINFLGQKFIKEDNFSSDQQVINYFKEVISKFPFSKEAYSGILQIFFNDNVFFKNVEDKEFIDLMFFKQNVETQELYKLSNDDFFILNDKNIKNQSTLKI